MPDPIYTTANCPEPAYQLDWSYSVFWRSRPPDFAWFEELQQLNEPDGIRVLQHEFKEPNVSQFLISTRPKVARGADRLAAEWAQERGIPVLACPVDRKQDGRAARPKRNRRMLAENPDLVVALLNESESGHMTLIAEDAGVTVIYPEDMPELWSANEPG